VENTHRPAVYIYNCKSCKRGKRVEYPNRQRSGDGFVYWRTDAAGKAITAGVHVTACGGGKPTIYAGDTENGICACGKMMTFGKLNARVNVNHKCDARCTSARGHNCECACGGAMHGVAA